MKRLLIFIFAARVFSIEYIISENEMTNSLYPVSVYKKAYGKVIGADRIESLYKAARYYNISPAVILALAQRESGQLARPTRSINDYFLGAWIHYDAARGTNEYKSFSRQIWLSPYRLRYWMDRAAADKYRIAVYDRGEQITITASNAPTYALYRYTHFYRGKAGSGYHGNYTFPMIYADIIASLGSNAIDNRGKIAYHSEMRESK